MSLCLALDVNKLTDALNGGMKRLRKRAYLPRTLVVASRMNEVQSSEGDDELPTLRYHEFAHFGSFLQLFLLLTLILG